MVVYLHSTGSRWTRKDRPKGGTSIWVSTGISDGEKVRARSKVFGQVALGRQAVAEINRIGGLRRHAWIASELSLRAGIRQMQLIHPAPEGAKPEWFLVTVTESLVGRIHENEQDPNRTIFIAQSSYKTWQETMLLVQPIGNLLGEDGVAVLMIEDGECRWRVTRWRTRA